MERSNLGLAVLKLEVVLERSNLGLAVLKLEVLLQLSVPINLQYLKLDSLQNYRLRSLTLHLLENLPAIPLHPADLQTNLRHYLWVLLFHNLPPF